MKLGIIGSGNMASALLSGFLDSEVVSPSDVFISDKDENKLLQWKSKGVNCFTDNLSVVDNSDLIIFAVKPGILSSVLCEISEKKSDKLFLSIAAGYKLEKIENYLGNNARIIRAMPNTPALVRCGMTVISPNKNVGKDDIDIIKKLLVAVGEVVELEEKFINIATALHGSSPAYVYMLIEAMSDSGVKYGLSKETSRLLAAKAVEGAAKMVLESDEHIMKLKDNVCSPGGTTIEAVLTLEENGFCTGVQKAIDSCVTKADTM